MNRFALVLPYYGVFPPYFGRFLKSVENKRFDVLFISDLMLGKRPPNVKVIPIDFQSFRLLAAQKLEVNIDELGLDTPKKLCDFKPMYGKICEDYLRGYDYWMFGDCDLVYGNRFNDYLEGIISSRAEIVSMRNKWVSGPCCILRNNEKLCTLFKRARNWREVVTEHGDNNLWDECGLCCHKALEDGSMTMADCEEIRDSFGAVVFRSSDIVFRHADDITEMGLKGRFVHMCGDGTLWVDGEEISLYHYISIKTRRFFTCAPVDYVESGEFWIDETGFYDSIGVWRLHYAINFWRKICALCVSVRVNGPTHWIRRVKRLFK